MDEDMGFAAVGNIKGDALGNAMLKAVTKAKRRVTLSICGLGMLDETEVASIPEPVPVPQQQQPPQYQHLQGQSSTPLPKINPANHDPYVRADGSRSSYAGD